MSDSQLRPLLALRWRMVRSGGARCGFAALAAVVPLLCVLAGVAGVLAPDEGAFDVTLLAPTAYVSVAVLAVLSPLVAGGGNELFPDEQLVAYPVTAATRYIASLALTPLNLAWVTQVVGLVGITTFIAAPLGDRYAPAILTCLAYVALVTVAGQAIGWLVTGVRQRPPGRWVTWALAAVLVVGAVAVVVTENVVAVLEKAPTTYVVLGALYGAGGQWEPWLQTTGTLLVLTAVAFLAGRRACAWALRQPGDAASRIDSQVVTRRHQRSGTRRQVMAVDRASVWRSPSLRRGLLVLAVLPGLVAAVAGLEWASLVLLPGLVAAGAGLLFGVNAFCLDGSASVWLASLPGRPGTAYWCKAQVVAETCVVAMTITVVAGSLRAGRLPSTGEAAAVAGCAAATLLRVVATCMVLSVTRPHRADLRGPRDTPAPPGVMAAYSARLAVSTTLIAVLFSALAQTAPWHWSLAVAVPLVLLSARRLLLTAGRWADPVQRSLVVTAVASG